MICLLSVRLVFSFFVFILQNNLQKEQLECKKSSGLGGMNKKGEFFIIRKNNKLECLKSVINGFEICLQKEAPKVKKCVGEYIKAFDDIVSGRQEEKY